MSVANRNHFFSDFKNKFLFGLIANINTLVNSWQQNIFEIVTLMQNRVKLVDLTWNRVAIINKAGIVNSFWHWNAGHIV